MFLQACPKTFRLGSQLEHDVIGNVIGNVTGVPKGFKNMRGSKNHAAIALTIRAIRAMRQGNIKSGQCPHPVIHSRWDDRAIPASHYTSHAVVLRFLPYLPTLLSRRLHWPSPTF